MSIKVYIQKTNYTELENTAKNENKNTHPEY